METIQAQQAYQMMAQNQAKLSNRAQIKKAKSNERRTYYNNFEVIDSNISSGDVSNNLPVNTQS
jgi:hypothetical protein